MKRRCALLLIVSLAAFLCACRREPAQSGKDSMDGTLREEMEQADSENVQGEEEESVKDS